MSELKHMRKLCSLTALTYKFQLLTVRRRQLRTPAGPAPPGGAVFAPRRDAPRAIRTAINAPACVASILGAPRQRTTGGARRAARCRRPARSLPRRGPPPLPHAADASRA